jgi:hypothetical protein
MVLSPVVMSRLRVNSPSWSSWGFEGFNTKSSDVASTIVGAERSRETATTGWIPDAPPGTKTRRTFLGEFLMPQLLLLEAGWSMHTHELRRMVLLGGENEVGAGVDHASASVLLLICFLLCTFRYRIASDRTANIMAHRIGGSCLPVGNSGRDMTSVDGWVMKTVAELAYAGHDTLPFMEE